MFSDYEVDLMEQAAPVLINDIEMGKCFVVQHKKKQKNIDRRCSSSSKNQSFFDLCSKLEVKPAVEIRKQCEQRLGGQPCSVPKTRCNTKILKGQSERPIAENKVNAVGLESGSAFMVVESEGKKDFFLGSLWLTGGRNSAWNDDIEEVPNTVNCSPDDDYIVERKRLSRKNMFFSALQLK